MKANVAVKTILDKEVSSIPRLGLSLSAQQAVNDLAFHVSTFMNNELRGQRQSMQRSGLPSKSITSRLKGKDLIFIYIIYLFVLVRILTNIFFPLRMGGYEGR